MQYDPSFAIKDESERDGTIRYYYDQYMSNSYDKVELPRPGEKEPESIPQSLENITDSLIKFIHSQMYRDSGDQVLGCVKANNGEVFSFSSTVIGFFKGSRNSTSDRRSDKYDYEYDLMEQGYNDSDNEENSASNCNNGSASHVTPLIIERSLDSDFLLEEGYESEENSGGDYHHGTDANGFSPTEQSEPEECFFDVELKGDANNNYNFQHYNEDDKENSVAGEGKSLLANIFGLSLIHI